MLAWALVEEEGSSMGGVGQDIVKMRGGAVRSRLGRHGKSVGAPWAGAYLGSGCQGSLWWRMVGCPFLPSRFPYLPSAPPMCKFYKDHLCFISVPGT